jgi:hypothetical protein
VPVLVGIDDVDGTLLVVLVAFHAVFHDDIPAQVIMENPGSHAKHLFEQMTMLFRVMRLHNNDHDEMTRWFRSPTHGHAMGLS